MGTAIVKGVVSMKKRRVKDNEPTFAPGDDEELEQSASEEEIARGDYTEVTRLSWDEVDPSGENK